MKRPCLHQARLAPWSADELKAHLASIVDELSVEKDASPLAVMLELLGGEMEASVLFGRVGHLDPPRPDGKIPIGVLQHKSADPTIDARIRNTVRSWLADQEPPATSQGTHVTEQLWRPEQREDGVYLVAGDGEGETVLKLCRSDHGSDLLIAGYVAGLQAQACRKDMP